MSQRPTSLARALAVDPLWLLVAATLGYFLSQ